MIEVCEVVAVEPIQEGVEFTDHSVHRLQHIWCKSIDEESQGKWTTFVKLYDKAIDENAGIKAGDAVSLEITPASRPAKNGQPLQSIIVKLKGVA